MWHPPKEGAKCVRKLTSYPGEHFSLRTQSLPSFLHPPSSPQPHLLSLETYSSSFNIWLKRQHISEVFLDNHKSLRLCPVCESEQCYFLILFIYTIFFKPVTEDKKKELSGPWAQMERVSCSGRRAALIWRLPVAPKHVWPSLASTVSMSPFFSTLSCSNGPR